MKFAHSLTMPVAAGSAAQCPIPRYVMIVAAYPEALCSRSVTSLLCYYGLMCQSCCLSVTSLCWLFDWVFAAQITHCWSTGPSRRLPLRILPWMLGPLPRLSQ